MNVNPDLAKERQQATFDVERLTRILYGSMLEKKRKVVELALNCKEITNVPNYHFLSRPEKYAEAMKKTATVLKLMRDHKIENEDIFYLLEVAFPNEVSPVQLHFGMFLPMLESQCSEEQKAKWLKKAKTLEIIGTYAQTELGHGSNVRALETTATYDPLRKDFVMHSPTITSAKFWPGALGKTVNHAVVMARLYTGGKFHGVHPFFVQLRDFATHMPLPGVTIGDIGPKFGYDTIDNGFLRFNNVRIPRENLLMRNAKVLEDGTFVKIASHDKLSYGVMLFTRAMLVLMVSARGLAQAVTIAIRYSCVRHQSELKPGEPEAQIIDFQTQQYKLFVPLAATYAYWFAGLKMRSAYLQLEQELRNDDTSSLPELHATSAGVKAFTTAGMMYSIEQCRLACGGHGYSHASGLPKIYVHCSPACTYEGENTVMLLQTARFLAKSFQEAHSGQPVTRSVAYLSEKLPVKSTLKSCLNIESLVNAYKHRAKRLLARACTRLAELQGHGSELYDAWNKSSVYLVKAAEAHCNMWVIEAFAESLTLTGCGGCPAVLAVLTDLFRLYATSGILVNSGDFTEDGYMSAEQLSAVNDGLLTLMERLRPNAVALVDAFDLSDHQLGSVLGRYDGQVYENLYKWAAESPLNATEVHPSRRFLKELVDQSKL
jgi:acyl-CoA oxidase